MKYVDPKWMIGIVNEAGEKNRAEGCHRLVKTIREGLKEKKFTADNFSYRGIALALGCLDPYDPSGSFELMASQFVDTSRVQESRVFQESNPGVHTNAFQIVTGELISSKVIEGYETDEGYIGDKLVTVMPSRLRNQRIAGMTYLAGPEEVKEGHPYPESGFEEKYVTTNEAKKGRILSINEELLLLDQTSEINRRALNLGAATRQERERVIVRGVQDADSSTSPVYRPSGSGTTLYATSGANFNYIGSGGVTGYSSAVGLADWTDVDTVLSYRATQVKDDRLDGTQRPISGLNKPSNILLVPEAKRSTAWYIKNATSVEKVTNSAVDVTHVGNPVSSFIGEILTSPFVDEVNGDNWYYGDPKKQFVWTEIMPLTTSTQGRDSESSFDRDVALRVKVRYYGGISAIETRWFTMVDGA
jgi:hypothetical protein